MNKPEGKGIVKPTKTPKTQQATQTRTPNTTRGGKTASKVGANNNNNRYSLTYPSPGRDTNFSEEVLPTPDQILSKIEEPRPRLVARLLPEVHEALLEEEGLLEEEASPTEVPKEPHEVFPSTPPFYRYSF